MFLAVIRDGSTQQEVKTFETIYYNIQAHNTKSAIPTKKTTKTILVLACLYKKT